MVLVTEADWLLLSQHLLRCSTANASILYRCATCDCGHLIRRSVLSSHVRPTASTTIQGLGAYFHRQQNIRAVCDIGAAGSGLYHWYEHLLL